jgi:hypothetical protein
VQRVALSEYLPAEQLVQTEAPEVEVCPAPQVVQAAEALAPTVAEAFPDSQFCGRKNTNVQQRGQNTGAGSRKTADTIATPSISTQKVVSGVVSKHAARGEGCD